MKKAEAQKRMYAIMQRYLKLEDRSGLSQIDIPDMLIDNPKKDEDPVKYKRVVIKEDMEKHLLAHHLVHFGQAEGTPFTTPPLSNLVDFTGKSDFCQKFRAGEVDIDKLQIDKATKLFLKELQPAHDDPPQISSELTREQLINGFKIWKERTSTSPE
eukprot:scaffold194729_cov26-Attheya_sp.AAC.1